MPSINANSLRVGHIVDLENSFWKVTSIEKVKPGKGGAFVQSELKNIDNDKKRNERFRSDSTIELADGQTSDAIFLMRSGNSLEFSDLTTFETIECDASIMTEDQQKYLTDNVEVKILILNNRPVEIRLPDTMKLKITETQPYIKGQTVTATFKPATLENGVNTSIPQYIELDSYIIVRTEDNSYVERAK